MRILLSVCLTMLLFFSYVMVGLAAIVKANKTVMATVNGKNITAADITTSLWGNLGAQALTELIAERVLLDEAAKRNITADDSVVNSLYEQSINGKDKKEINSNLARIGWTEKDVKEKIKRQITINNLVVNIANIVITDEEIKKLYNENKDKLVTTESYNVSQINVDKIEIANKLVDQLISDKNADFGAISAANSIDKNLSANNGLVGNITRGMLPENLESEIFALRPGQISKIIAVGSNFSIFKVNAINKARQLELADVKESLRSTLLTQKINEKRPAVLAELLKEAKITVK